MIRLLLFLAFTTAFLPFAGIAQHRYDLLITEFLADPSPSAGLPESSFIEITNHSPNDYLLRNWKISNGKNTAQIKSDLLLKSDSIVILCSTSSAPGFAPWGPTIGLSSFPSLNNDSGSIMLISDSDQVIDAVYYYKSWYRNALKEGGGWSLEMIDLSNCCAGADNWNASVASTGGTPGTVNSVNNINPDLSSPSLLRVLVTDSLNLDLVFDEPLDSSSASSTANYFLSDNTGAPVQATTSPPFFDHVQLQLQTPLAHGKTYSLSLLHITDCGGNEIGESNYGKFGFSEKPEASDIIFNEILFNPPPFGFDYVEVFNRSDKIISLNDLFIAGRDQSGAVTEPDRLTGEARVIFPGEYVAVTENKDWLLKQYPLAESGYILEVRDLPSLPDDAGKIVLLSTYGKLIDELDYDHHWHSPLLASESGIALERISPSLPTSQSSNWSSAASDAGNGTPGYKNSESLSGEISSQELSVDPKIFSPDLDGYNDFCFIKYHFLQTGFMGSISIFDLNGRMVRKLVNNTTWSDQGNVRWDGLDDNQRLLPMGHYIIYVELFLLDGTVRTKKMVVVVARK